MIVIADASSINYLILIQEIDILPTLYRRIVVPYSVCEELKRPLAPQAVRQWISQPPDWLDVSSPERGADGELSQLAAGERDAILLAEELGADQLIIDEMKGRRIAERRHLAVSGTIGVLRAAAKLGLIDPNATMTRLRQTHFRVSQEILDSLGRGD